MKLQATVKNLEDLDKSFHTLYEKDGDSYILTGVETGDYKEKISEFRNNNIELSNKLKAYEGVDAEKYHEMENRFKTIEEDKLRESGKFEELAAKQNKEMETKYQSLLQQANTAAEAKERELADYKQVVNTAAVNTAITQAITETASIRPGALPDILHRASSVFSVKSDGTLEAKDGSGLKAGEWAKDLVSTAPFFFEASAGGNAGGGNTPLVTGTTILATDSEAFSANLEAIASGKVTVL